MSFVQTAAARLQSVPFASSSASPTLEKRVTQTTGPKISSGRSACRLDSGEHGRLHEEDPISRARASAHDARPFTAPDVDIFEHAGHLVLGDERAERGAGLQRVADAQA
jgi:hypothetical protein